MDHHRPTLDRRVSMEATPELRALLRQRLLVVEGNQTAPGRTPRAVGGYGCSVTALGSAPVRLPSQRVREVSSFGGSDCAPLCSRATQAVRAPLNAAAAAAICSPLALTYDARAAHSLELRVGAMDVRNVQLAQEIAKIKDGAAEDDGSLFSEERERLLAETDELLAETDRMTARNQEMVAQRAELQAEANEFQASVAQVEELKAECKILRLSKEQKEVARAQAGDRVAMELQVSAMTQEIHALRDENNELRLANSRVPELEVKVRTLANENERLAARTVEAQQELERQMQQRATQAPATNPAPADAGHSESRLRAVMASVGTSTSELQQAISGVEAMLDEAKRELAAKQFRERRAAFEQLHAAIESQRPDEDVLEQAIIAARSAQVENEDVEKAETKLAELRSLTPEERRARAMRELEAKLKKEAFLLVKKDDAAGLMELLDSLDQEIRWRDWRDYAGRTLVRCAKELRVSFVHKALEERLGDSGDMTQRLTGAFTAAAARAALKAAEQAAMPETDESFVSEAPLQRSVTPQPEAVATSDLRFSRSASGRPCNDQPEKKEITTDEEEKLKARALRAVVQDDSATLGEVLNLAPVDKWSRWENKAGKDLLTLSQERGSSSAYSALARALGMLKEAKREAFAERETVWVFITGDVQPRRATVLEDTPEEADQVLVEYWDGDAPPERVDRCIIRRMWS
mmetsp:Transcript_85682/g.164938  ORF Transcript_85682/g.164938 Transcript_85682/m.164938 type:complete len:696 (-) Transcript_85682:62-2149(-)